MKGELDLPQTTGRTPMTVHERNISASIDPLKLDRLAEVAIKVGLQLRPGQDLLLKATAVALPLVRKVSENAYLAGSCLVMPILSDMAVYISTSTCAMDDISASAVRLLSVE